MQLHDLKGNIITTVNLGDNTTTAWCSYDEYGNPNQNNPTNTNSINYTTYGQAERATNTTGLILMGARVYNPITNQFTSPDPIKGGNEGSYTYPNDPLGSSDYSGTDSCSTGSALARFCVKPLTAAGQALARAWAGFAIKSMPTEPVLLGSVRGNFLAKSKTSRYTTFHVKNYHWLRNKAFIDLSIRSGLRILLSDSPYRKYTKDTGGTTFAKEVSYLKSLGFYFEKRPDGLWEAMRK